MNTLVEKRAEKFVRRRQDDVQDQSVLCNAGEFHFQVPVLSWHLILPAMTLRYLPVWQGSCSGIKRLKKVLVRF